MKHVLLLTVITLLSACAYSLPRPGASGPARPYDQGCASGYVAAGHPWYTFSKDTQRYVSDAVYKSQWDDGFVVCKGSYEATGRAMAR